MAVVRTLILVAFLVFGPVSGTVVAESFFTSENYLKGKFAFDEGDYEIAVKLWMDSAKQGQPEAQGFIGAMYHAGYGVEKDYGMAMKWYLKAAKKGVAQAQLGIGNMYGDGLGVEKDYVKARMWFEISADAGNQRAEYNSRKVAQRMTEADIAKADSMALDWIKTH